MLRAHARCCAQRWRPTQTWVACSARAVDIELHEMTMSLFIALAMVE